MALRLHLGCDGLVWYGDDRRVAEASDLSAADYFSGQSPAAERVWLLGSRGNAPLVAAAAAAGVPVTLWSPAVVPEAQRADPRACLAALVRPPALPARPLTPAVAAAYALAAAVDAHGPASAEAAAAAEEHPAWAACTYGPVAGDLACARQLLSDVLDPQWFRHPVRPARDGRLTRYLGLALPNAARWLGPSAPGLDRQARRSLAAFHAWYGRGVVTSWHPAADPPTPRQLLAATRRYVRFVCRVWSAALAAHHAAAFDPFRFFASPDEAQRFDSHRSSVGRV